nr:uncharacterized protein LOC109179062 [Ipomoea batatas]
MLQFKEIRIVRKCLIISTWTAKVDKKRYADERKYDRYCKSKVLEIIAKPNVEKENEDVHTLEKEDKNVQIDRGVGENAAMNDVEKVSTMLKKLAAIVVEFEKELEECSQALLVRSFEWKRGGVFHLPPRVAPKGDGGA